jgi:hypothetical protein
MLALTPEFMAALEEVVLSALRKSGVSGARNAPCDPENEWLNTQQARTFLRLSKSAFDRFKVRYKADLRVSTTINPTEPRYQLASLQKLMREKAVGGLEPAAAAATPAPLLPAPKKRRIKIDPFPRRGSADVRTPEHRVLTGTLF